MSTESVIPAFVGFDWRDFESDFIVVVQVTRSPQTLFAQSAVGVACGSLFPPQPEATNATHGSRCQECEPAHGLILHGPRTALESAPGC